MATIEPFPHLPPMPAVTRILSRHDRASLAAFVTVAIDLLDAMDGDPDAEEDDPAGQCDEDEVNTSLDRATGNGPGCLISDDDSAIDDGNCDDLNQDLEEEAWRDPYYGEDQSKGPVSPVMEHRR